MQAYYPGQWSFSGLTRTTGPVGRSRNQLRSKIQSLLWIRLSVRSDINPSLPHQCDSQEETQITNDAANMPPAIGRGRAKGTASRASALV